jgi:hypothetical protein
MIAATWMLAGCASSDPDSQPVPIDEIAEVIEVELCEPEQCGPASMMPNTVCADGSTGGPTGRCIHIEGEGCIWEIRQCPDSWGNGSPVTKSMSNSGHGGSHETGLDDSGQGTEQSVCSY